MGGKDEEIPKLSPIWNSNSKPYKKTLNIPSILGDSNGFEGRKRVEIDFSSWASDVAWSYNTKNDSACIVCCRGRMDRAKLQVSVAAFFPHAIWKREKVKRVKLDFILIEVAETPGFQFAREEELGRWGRSGEKGWFGVFCIGLGTGKRRVRYKIKRGWAD